MKTIAKKFVGKGGFTYGPGSENECASAYETFKAQVAEFSLVGAVDRERIWREAAAFDEVTGVPAKDLRSLQASEQLVDLLEGHADGHSSGGYRRV